MKTTSRWLGLLTGVVTLGGLVAWVHSSTASKAGTPAPDGKLDSEPGKPFMFNEAKLPAGYPPPGPVGVVIVKQYPVARLAQVRASEVSRPGQNDMFQPLFRHISRNDIAMTAPVIMDYAPGTTAASQPTASETMAFLYASTEIGRPGRDGVVEVFDGGAMTVLSVGMRGGYGDSTLAEGLKLIEAHLDSPEGVRYRVVGPPRLLGYNSPMVPSFLRYSEVQVPVEIVAGQ